MTEEICTYYYRSLRGPGIGHQPDGFNPDRRNSVLKRRPTPLGPRHFYGSVEYPQPLTMKQIYDFELWAADPVQWAKYLAWTTHRESNFKSLWLFESYTEALADPRKAELLKNEVEAVACKILLEAGITIESLEKEFENADS